MLKNLKLLILLMFVLLLAACGGNTEGTSGTSSDTGNDSGSGSEEANEDEKYTLRYSIVGTETHSSGVAITELMDKLEEMSDGRLNVEFYPSGQLFPSERENVEAVQLGNIEMTMVTTSALSSFVSQYMVFELPYLFETHEDAYYALDTEGEVGDKLAGLLGDVALQSLGYSENGYRHVTNNKKPVNTPEDMKGLTIRSLESKLHQDMFIKMGANSSPLAFGEVYSALQQRTFDGMDSPIGLINSSKFYEVQDYLSLTGHMYAPSITLINKDLYEGMPEDLQEILMDWSLQVNKRQREIANEEEKALINTLKEHMEINEVSAENKAKFKELLLPLYEEYKEQIGSDIIDMVTE